MLFDNGMTEIPLKDSSMRTKHLFDACTANSYLLRQLDLEAEAIGESARRLPIRTLNSLWILQRWMELFLEMADLLFNQQIGPNDRPTMPLTKKMTPTSIKTIASSKEENQIKLVALKLDDSNNNKSKGRTRVNRRWRW